MKKQTKIAIALILATIVGGLVITIIFVPSVVEKLEEIVKDETQHPCQIAALEEFYIFRDNAQYRSDSNSTAEEYEEYSKELLMRVEVNKKLFEENNCNTTQSEWYTSEFRSDFEDLLEKGF